MWGKVRCMARYSEAVEPGTVWTWNAIGKASGAWNLAPGANEAEFGFLLNHLISDELPHPSRPGIEAGGESFPGDGHISNSDPITGQAGWYDVRVRIYKAGADEAQQSWPQVTAVAALPGMDRVRKTWLAFVAGTKK
jgi:anaerobic selenocysteine-containing dehydrogenase